MNSVPIDGVALAKQIKESLKPRIDAVERKLGRTPGLLIVAAAEGDRASRAYRASQMKAAQALRLRCQELSPARPDAKGILEEIREKPGYKAVVVDLPLPGVDVDELLSGLPAERDAEGATPSNFGRLFELKRYEDLKTRGLVAPCTAVAIAELVRATGLPLAGKTAVVLGRSNIVGKPAAHLLSCLDMTVTLCHSKTRELEKVVAQADVVVAAMGRARMVRKDWLKQGAVVIDAGINADGKGLVGDVDPAAYSRCSFYTPVPGGVGPVTTAVLLANAVTLAERKP